MSKTKSGNGKTKQKPQDKQIKAVDFKTSLEVSR